MLRFFTREPEYQELNPQEINNPVTTTAILEGTETQLITAIKNNHSGLSLNVGLTLVGLIGASIKGDSNDDTISKSIFAGCLLLCIGGMSATFYKIYKLREAMLRQNAVAHHLAQVDDIEALSTFSPGNAG